MKVKALLLNNGTYDGLKHLDFPIEVEADHIQFLNYVNYVNVPMSELLRIGYDPVAGGVGELPDTSDMQESLPFILSWGEVEIMGVAK